MLLELLPHNQPVAESYIDSLQGSGLIVPAGTKDTESELPVKSFPAYLDFSNSQTNRLDTTIFEIKDLSTNSLADLLVFMGKEAVSCEDDLSFGTSIMIMIHLVIRLIL